MKLTTDPLLPSNYLSWRDIGKAESLNMERMSNVANTTLSKLQAKSIEMGYANLKAFSAYYNAYSNSLIANKEYNYFLTIGKIEPVAHLFRLFVANRISRTRTDCNGGNIYEVVDFGILKSHWDYYKKHNKPPNIQNRGNTKKNFNNPAENPRTKIDLPKTPVYQRFVAVIKAANAQSKDKVTIPQMVLICIEYYMQKHPALFGSLDFEVADDSKIRVKDNENLHVQIPSEIMRWLSATLARYNSANTITLTLSQFVTVLIKEGLERRPVKYTDPELAEELREQEDKA